jgi:alanine-glyoxylate transaminase/serine-glyoxylate transaminase/serine-pyruvate transaminase
MAKQKGMLTIVDAVTSLGGVPLLVDEWQLDAVYSGSQKCLSCVPGLSPLTFSEAAIEKIQSRTTPIQSWFLDQSLVLGYWSGAGKRSYHHTAPVNTLYALHESLLKLHQEGLEAAWARHRNMHDQLRAGLEALGLTFVVDENVRLPQLNSVYIPDGVDDAEVRQYLLQHFNLEIGAGLGALAGKAWRIGLMGYSAREENVALCLSALEQALGKCR